MANNFNEEEVGMKRWITVMIMALVLSSGMATAQTPSNFELTPTAIDAVLATARLNSVGALDSAYVATMPDTGWVATFPDSTILIKEITGLAEDRYYDFAVVTVDTLGFKRVSLWLRYSTGKLEAPVVTATMTSTTAELDFAPVRIAPDSIQIVKAADSSYVASITDPDAAGHQLILTELTPGELYTYKAIAYGASRSVYSATIAAQAEPPQIEPVIADAEWLNDIVSRPLYRADAWLPDASGARGRTEQQSRIVGGVSLPDTIPISHAGADSTIIVRQLYPVIGLEITAEGDSTDVLAIWREVMISGSSMVSTASDTLAIAAAGFYTWKPRHSPARYGYIEFLGGAGNGDDTVILPIWINRSRK